jgi:hypothetical protein
MKKKEKLFCRFYAKSLNLHEAARKAGYRTNAEKTALKLTEREDIRKEIKRQLKKDDENNLSCISAGLKRLAFGNVSDAIKLIFAQREQIDDEFIESLDLYNVSEIKFQKSGSIEIKFADRIKALTLLSQLQNGDDTDSALPFYKALEKSAEKLDKVGYDDE